MDENLDVRLAALLLTEALPDGVVASSCRDEGWLGVRDRALLEAMAAHVLTYVVLVTADRGLWPQHCAVLRRLGIGVVLVRAPRTALERVARIGQAVQQVEVGAQLEVSA